MDEKSPAWIKCKRVFKSAVHWDERPVMGMPYSTLPNTETPPRTLQNGAKRVSGQMASRVIASCPTN